MRDREPGASRPQLSWPVWLAAQLAGGALAGCALAAAGGLIGAQLGRGNPNGFADLINSVLGQLLGYVLGAPLGVAGVARRLGLRGSFWLALLGSVLGAAAALLLAEPLGLNRDSAVMLSAFGALALLAALAGFHSRR